MSRQRPVPRPGPARPKPGDSAAVAAQRVRMGTDEIKQIYGQRCDRRDDEHRCKAHRGMAATRVAPPRQGHPLRCRFVVTYNILRFLTVTA